MPGCMKHRLESRLTGEISITSDMEITSPVTLWQIDGETMETVTDFIFWAPKSPQMMTAAMKLKDACSLEENL